jgi:N-acetylglucosaminyl-diphospho-decaprenol L-rhamnosyltransferase
MSTALSDVSVILVSWNTRELLLQCLDSLAAACEGIRYDTWVVDNGSTDGSIEAVRGTYPAAHLIVNEQNVGFAGANNQAMELSEGRYALLLNSDTIAPPGSITTMVRFADTKPRAGVVGAMLLNPDQSFQASYSDFPSLLSEFLSVSGIGSRILFRNYPSYSLEKSRATRKVGYVPGACMLARRSAIAEVGVMDDQYFMYSEENDWCLRMKRAGWETWYHPEATIIHYGGQSTKQRRHAMLVALYRSKVRFFKKHYGPLQAAILHGIFFSILRIKWLLTSLRLGRQRAADRGSAIRWHDLQSQR